LSNFGTSFLELLSGLREGQTFLNSKLLDVHLLEKSGIFLVRGEVPFTINTLGRICAWGGSMPSFSTVTAYDVRGTTLLCVPEFQTPEAPHRVRDIPAAWDMLATKINVERESRHLKG
jgi:hypothetical protein